MHPKMCFLPFKSQACYSGQEDIKQKYFLPLPLLLLFCCYSYYYYHHYHHHNSVTTISFITMICSFVSPQIHYFLFHFFHQPPSATHSSQICLFTYYETFRYTFFHILKPKSCPILVMMNAQLGHVLRIATDGLTQVKTIRIKI